jgi:hypothetical protein
VFEERSLFHPKSFIIRLAEGGLMQNCIIDRKNGFTKRNIVITVLFVSAVLLGALPLAVAAGGNAKVMTAQSGMIDLSVSPQGPFYITGSETWHLDTDLAKAAYSNAWDGNNPAVSCTGNAANCDSTNQPTTPTRPAPDPIKQGDAIGDRCIFWDGGTLPSDTYTQYVTINGINGKGNWKFTWTYNFGGDTVAAKTAWYLQDSSTTTPTVTIQSQIMSLSVLEKTNPLLWKASFTLQNSDGSPRINNLKVVVIGPDGNTILDHTFTSEEIAVFTQTDSSGPIDFDYSGNAGENGQVGILSAIPPLHALASSIVNGGVISADGKYDNFLGNNYVEGIGSPAIARADIADQEIVLTQEGTYTITISGVLKDSVDGLLSLPISATSTLTISAMGCA